MNIAIFLTEILNNSQTLLIVIFFYIVALWLMFCLWVFIDANRRYQKMWLAIVFTALVLVFNFPAFIFYLIIRPEEDELIHHNHGGVNVPVANFIGNNGEVVMSLNLRINGEPSQSSDMNVNVEWNSDKVEKQSFTRPTIAQVAGFEDQSENNPIKARLDSIKSKAENSLKQVVDTSKRRVENYSSKLNSEDRESQPSVAANPAKSGKSAKRHSK